MDQKYISSGMSVEKSIGQEDGEYQLLVNFLAELNPELRRACMELLASKSYLPEVVGLGFFHHKMSPTLFEMEKLKVKALCNTVKRINDMTVEKLVAHVMDLKEEISDYYMATGWKNWTEAAWMLTVDACFILEFLRSLCGDNMDVSSKSSSKFDANEKTALKLNFDRRWKLSFDRRKALKIMRDILKTGNQIPLCVLLKILQLEFETPEKAVSALATMLILRPQFKLLPFSLKPIESKVFQSEVEAYINEGAYHLLHLVSNTIKHVLTPSSSSNRGCSSTNSADDIPPSVESLQKLGIKFNPSTNGEVRFEKRWFTSSILYLPQIHLDEDTEPLLRDLMIAEHYSGSEEKRVICDFIAFMNYLICSRKDSVAVLRKERIIISGEVSDEELSTRFNNLCKGTTRGCGQFGAVARQVKGRQNNFPNWCREFGAMAAKLKGNFINLFLPPVAVAVACGIKVFSYFVDLGIKLMVLLSEALLYLAGRLKVIQTSASSFSSLDSMPSSQKDNETCTSPSVSSISALQSTPSSQKDNKTSSDKLSLSQKDHEICTLTSASSVKSPNLTPSSQKDNETCLSLSAWSISSLWSTTESEKDQETWMLSSASSVNFDTWFLSLNTDTNVSNVAEESEDVSNVAEESEDVSAEAYRSIDISTKADRSEGVRPVNTATSERCTVGRELAAFLVSSEILHQAWKEIQNVSTNNLDTFVVNECEGLVYVTFRSLYEEDFIVRDGRYGECNIQNQSTVFSDTPGIVHEGTLNRFLQESSNLEAQMKNFLNQKEEQTIIFVGHSIGGAVATLATLWILKKRVRHISPFCITFGSPLMGDARLGEAIGREGWSGKFCHVVSKYDIVPRMLLAPFESIAQPLNAIVPYWQNLMDIDSVAVSHLAIGEACTTLLKNVLQCTSTIANNYTGESGDRSPYRPFGTYMFCSTQGAACIEDAEAVLKMLHFTMQGIEEMFFDQNGGACISWHTGYGHMLEDITEYLLNATEFENFDSYSSFETGISLELEAMGVGAQNQNALLALGKAGEVKNERDMNIEKLNFDLYEELSEHKSQMAVLEWYKWHCKENGPGYYDIFKQKWHKKDFHVDLTRKKLNSFWDNVIEMAERHELPSDIQFQNKWINAGTAYRRLVEPLDIADCYRKRKGNYLLKWVRPHRYIVLEKWLKEKDQTLIGRAKESRTKFASLTVDSCFWAHLEDARKDLKHFLHQRAQHRVVNDQLKESLEKFEDYAWNMIKDKSISVEVFLEGSSFMRWWQKYRQLQHQSDLFDFMEYDRPNMKI